ncbi:alpha/beta fold hydrolase [Microbispora rosea]|uniref:alpha/beta fold hydrolase n=1 Tax=Microbispora rosea TaxID=58117 RepID=UPI003D92DA5B
MVLVLHSNGGMVITEAAGGDKLAGLVYVCAFAPEQGESAFALSTKFPGSTLGDALAAGLPTDAPAWRSIPSWFVFGDEDLNVPVALHRFMADRAGAKGIREVPGASHALSVSQPEVVTTSILDAMYAVGA